MRPDEVKGRLLEMASGELVERDVLNIAEKLRQYDPNLQLQYLDPSHFDAGIGDAPWRVLEMCKDGIPRVVLTAWELDERVLERIEAADNNRRDLIAVIDGRNEVIRRERNRRYEEERENEKDIIVSYLKSPKGRWSVEHKGKKITFDDQHGREAKVEQT